MDIAIHWHISHVCVDATTPFTWCKPLARARNQIKLNTFLSVLNVIEYQTRNHRYIKLARLKSVTDGTVLCRRPLHLRIMCCSILPKNPHSLSITPTSHVIYTGTHWHRYIVSSFFVHHHFSWNPTTAINTWVKWMYYARWVCGSYQLLHVSTTLLLKETHELLWNPWWASCFGWSYLPCLWDGDPTSTASCWNVRPAGMDMTCWTASYTDRAMVTV